MADTSQNNSTAAGLGFGRDFRSTSRFLNKDGTVNIKRLDGDKLSRIDVYHSLITMPWKRFIFMVLFSYLSANLIFATMYYLAGPSNFGNLTHTSSLGEFTELFFFSAQTLTTVGYGFIHPKSSLVSAIAAVESMFGLLGFALATGILYGRFSRPKANIRYSEHCVIAPYEGMSGFMFRLANTTQNELIEASAKVILVKNNLETKQREFLPLTLEIDKISFMPLTWTIVHPVHPDSPMFKLSKEDLIKSDAEFLILLTATNDTYSQVVHSRTSYKGEDLLENSKFVPLERVQKDGKICIDLRELDKIERLNP